jgi:hypothetical protein
LLVRYAAVADELREFFADHDRVARRILQSPQPPAKLSETVDAPPSASAGAEPAPPTVGGFRPLRLLGAGGMGRVYEAEDAAGLKVALKLISPEWIRSPTALERFRQEGRLASMIAHPRCVFVLRADEESGQPYIAMELMSGRTLKDLVEGQGPLPVTEAVSMILDVIEGLEEAHQAGVLHCDVKPANCYLDADGRVKIGDFGLSRSLTAHVQLTQAGAFVGTPLFASPEQLKGEPLDPRSDIYSVAATLYYLLTGQAPFQHAPGAAVIARVVSEPPPAPRLLRPDLPAALEQVVLRGLQRQREHRFQTLDELRDALLPFLPNQLSGAGLGARVGAYFLDCLPVGICSGVAVVWSMPDGLQISLPVYMGLTTVPFLYFWVTESLWGCSLGKRVLRLRVTQAGTWEQPGVGRTLVRTTLFFLTSAAATVWPLYAVLDRTNHVAWAACQVLAELLGLALRCSTMRARNGYRGLHEVLSGTQVMRLPPPRPAVFRVADKLLSLPRSAAPAVPLPRQVGGFAVRAVLNWDEEDRLLLGEDPTLGRKVWIWLQPAGASAISGARRDLARPARLRWLTAGELNGWQWNAFVAPPGATLPELVGDQGELGWPAARRLLEQLAEELETARQDQSLPATLSVNQVWVQPSGRLQLLDFRQGPGRSGKDATDPPNDEKLGLALMRQVATLALEGRPEPQGVNLRPIEAVVPLHARALLARVTGRRSAYERVGELRTDLAATQRQPVEATHALRALHVALLAFVLSIGLCSVFLWSRIGAITQLVSLDISLLRTEALLQALEDEQWRPELLEKLPNEHGLRRRASEYRQLLLEQQARDRAEQEVRWQNLDSLGKLTATEARKQLIRTELPVHYERVPGGPFAVRAYQQSGTAQRVAVIAIPGLRRAADRAAGDRRPERPPWLVMAICSINLVLFPALWVVWAFVTRGGVCLRLAGLALVRGNGQDARRWQCAWRTLLVWLPLLALLGGVISVDIYAPEWGRSCQVLQVLALGWVLGSAAVAIWSPRRGPHDWLAGTYVVPR